jgi:hypothetical protein
VVAQEHPVQVVHQEQEEHPVVQVHQEQVVRQLQSLVLVMFILSLHPQLL